MLTVDDHSPDPAYPKTGIRDVDRKIAAAHRAAHEGAKQSGCSAPCTVVKQKSSPRRSFGHDCATFIGSAASSYRQGTTARTTTYGLHGDGVLSRWTSISGGWRVAGTSSGFASVKAMALISKTRTYDTFLANTRGGALYTIHIPTTSPMKPVVKPVRTRTWQGFEFLIAQKCGNQGTLLLGIDKDTQSAYLYAVGHANGTATVIHGLGKVPGTFNDQAYFRWAAPIDPLLGE